jgi:hypothetical protein
MKVTSEDCSLSGQKLGKVEISECKDDVHGFYKDDDNDNNSGSSGGSSGSSGGSSGTGSRRALADVPLTPGVGLEDLNSLYGDEAGEIVRALGMPVEEKKEQKPESWATRLKKFKWMLAHRKFQFPKGLDLVPMWT